MDLVADGVFCTAADVKSEREAGTTSREAGANLGKTAAAAVVTEVLAAKALNAVRARGGMVLYKVLQGIAMIIWLTWMS